MSGNNIAHVSSVDQGLKMKIKRTKVPNKVDTKHEVVTSKTQISTTSTPQPSPTPSTPTISSVNSCVNFSTSSSSHADTSNTSTSSNNPIVSLVKSSNMSESGKSPSKTNCASLATSLTPDHKDSKSPKVKTVYSKKTKENKPKAEATLAYPSTTESKVPGKDNEGTTPGGMGGTLAHTVEPRPGDTVHVKRENPIHDPYEFNAKVEDKIELPPKKLKLEKAENLETATSPQGQQQQQQQVGPSPAHHQYQFPCTSSSSEAAASPAVAYAPSPRQAPQRRSVGTDAVHVGVFTDPECLGPCEPGTSVALEGIVWKETDNGLLVVNVTWKGKTYVGTLMDSTRFSWDPPRPSGCESPIEEYESKTAKGRGKRNNRANERTTDNRRLRKGSRRCTMNSQNAGFTAPPSPAKSDFGTASKRKHRPTDLDLNEKPKRSRSSCSISTPVESPNTDGYINCPEPNCNKKYKHMNGLRYHRTHAHQKSMVDDEEEEDADDEKTEKSDKKEKSAVSDRAERMKAKEKQRVKEQGDGERDSKDSIDDDIPLKEIANRYSQNSKSGRKPEDSDGKSENSKSADAPTKDDSISVNSTSTLSLESNNSNRRTECSTIAAVISDPPPMPSVVNSSGSISVVTTLKSPITSQVYQISPMSCLGGVTIITQTSSTPSMISAASVSSHQSNTFNSNTVPTSSLPMSLPTEKQSGKSLFSKALTSVRPIVPAPSQSTGPITNPVFQQNQSHSSLLKPIQPKPTVMGDYGTSSSALLDLNRDKIRKTKKRKEKESTAGESSSSQLISSGEMLASTVPVIVGAEASCDQPVVIKTSAPPKSFENRELSLFSSSIDRATSSPFQSALESKVSTGFETSTPTNQRTAIPPSSLPIENLPSSIDNKPSINDGVHSPAYSDISDANDSSSPPHQDSPKKDGVKKDGPHNGPHLGTEGVPLNQHFGNMPYYRSSSFYLQQSLNQSLGAGAVGKMSLKGNDENRQREESDRKNGNQRLLQATDVESQKSLINFYAHIHGVSPATVQYQYNLGAFNPAAIDYQMLAQQDSVIRQQLVDQQKRGVQDKMEESQRKSPSLNRSQPVASPGMETPVDSKSQDFRESSSTPTEKYSSLKDIRDSKHKHDSSQELYNQQHIQSAKLHQSHPHQSDMLRMQMFQQQKQKMSEGQRQEKRSVPPELKSGSQHVGSGGHGYLENIKKEHITEDDSKSGILDLKRSDVKEERSSSRSSVTDLSKTRPPSHNNHSNIPSSCSTQSSLNPPTQGIIPSMSGTSISGTGHFPYSSYYPFRPVEPNHPMYRSINPHLLPYPGSYIHHPSIPGYRLPVDSDGKNIDPDVSNTSGGLSDKNETLKSTGAKFDNSPLTPGVVAASAGTSGIPSASVHKIHELHEKGRSSPAVKSPAVSPTVKVNSDNAKQSSRASTPTAGQASKEKQREYTSSPPTQRHVHTHHHTHVVGSFQPLYPPEAYSAMFSHPVAAASFPAHQPATAAAPAAPTTPKP